MKKLQKNKLITLITFYVMTLIQFYKSYLSIFDIFVNVLFKNGSAHWTSDS